MAGIDEPEGTKAVAVADPVVAKLVPSKVIAAPLVRTFDPFRYATPFAVPPDSVTVDDALRVVNAPVFGVVAPTVPLIGPENPAAVSVVPSNVRFADPAKDPLLLY